MAYKITETRVLYVYKMASDRKGYLKVSDFFMDNDEYSTSDEEYLKLKAEEYLKQKSYAKDWDIEILYARNVTYEKDVIEKIDGHEQTVRKRFSVTAGDVCDVLLKSDVQKKYFARNEKDLWFKTDLPQVESAIRAVTEGRKGLLDSFFDDGLPVIKFRPEQETAISQAISKFDTKTGKKFLWNAKMRFGKTLCALEVIRRKNYKATLIVTHRPVVDDSWYEDFQKIFCHNNNKEKDQDGNLLTPYAYGSRSLESAEDRGDFYQLKGNAEQTHFVFFASMQFLRLSTLVNDGEGADDNPLKKDIMQYDWDFVVVDEAHEGTQTSLGARVIKELKKENTRMLSLSGTPFNLYEDFEQDEIYTWDYVSEQQAKKDWDENNFGDPNPYDVLPKMNIFVYTLKDLVDDIGDDITDTFKFTEFFRVWTGDAKKDHSTMPSPEHVGRFVHEDDVQKFLNKLVDGDGEKKFPYSPDTFQESFQHTLWIVPGVKEAKALESLLKQHPAFNEDNGVKVVNVAGDGSDEENRKALEAVNVAMRDYDYTITLSCGRLTTGVSVPNWTAVFYMKGSESTTAATFMQTIFRSQTHAVFGEGKQKRYCYVFDFAPERTLKVIAETAKMSVEVKMSEDIKKDKNGTPTIDNTSMEDEEHAQMEAFLALCPIETLDSGQMEHYDAGKLFSQLKKVYVERAVYSGFGDDSIYKMDKLMNLDPDLLERMGRITGKMTKFKVGTINRGAKPTTDEEKKKIKDAHKKKRAGKELTTEEKDLLEKERKEREEKKNRASTLRALAIRIPLLMYGAELPADVDNITLDNFTDNRIVDDASWDEFMPTGVTKEDFDQLKAAIDPDIFKNAGIRYRYMAKQADEMDIEERIDYIATIFSLFHNPDKETVLTPWRVVNMHMSQTIGGWCFFNQKFDGPNTVMDENNNEIETIQPRWVDQGKVTSDVFCDYNSRILEINSKTGLYPLYMAYSLFKCIKEPEFKKDGLTQERDTPTGIPASTDQKELTQKKETQKKDDLEIWKDVLQDNLFVVCRTPMAVNITKRTLAGFKNDIKMNVKCYEHEVLINTLVSTGIIKKDDKGVDKVDKTFYLDGKPSKMCDIIDVLRAKPELFIQDIVQGNEFWHVYPNIPLKNNENINNMKFDAIVGNPPYQIMDGGNGGSSIPIYNLFVDTINALAPNYSSLIIPARWTTGGKGLGDFRRTMINDKHISVFYDFFESTSCFPKVQIEGGICYFRRDSLQESECKVTTQWGNGHIEKSSRYLKEREFDIFIRDNNAIGILHKIMKRDGFVPFSSIVHSRNYYGLSSFPRHSSDQKDKISIIGLENRKRVWKYVTEYNNSSTSFDGEMLTKWKVFASKADGAAGQLCNPIPAKIIGKAELGAPYSVCTETFLAIGPFKTKDVAENVIRYMETKFFRFLVGIRKLKNMSQDTYSLVPIVDFHKSWDDLSLKKEYGLSDPEYEYIDNMISTM